MRRRCRFYGAICVGKSSRRGGLPCWHCARTHPEILRRKLVAIYRDHDAELQNQIRSVSQSQQHQRNAEVGDAYRCASRQLKYAITVTVATYWFEWVEKVVDVRIKALKDSEEETPVINPDVVVCYDTELDNQLCSSCVHELQTHDPDFFKEYFHENGVVKEN